MKRNFLLFCAIVLSLVVKAQNDSNSINTHILKKGFYKSYKEYLQNNPSILADFTTTYYSATKKDPTIVAGDYKLLDKTVSVKRPWGFCDGENVFIRYSLLPGHTYLKLQVLGPHPYVLLKHKTIVAVGAPLMMLATAAATAALPPGFDVLVITKSGKPKYAWKHTMKKVLASEPELLKAFKKEAVVLSNAHRVKYLTLYSKAVAGE